jgi:hypothetical protein
MIGELSTPWARTEIIEFYWSSAGLVPTMARQSELTSELRTAYSYVPNHWIDRLPRRLTFR